MKPTTDLEGVVAWVTGAGRGLGRAAAIGLAAAGARVVLTARRSDDLAEVSGITEGGAEQMPGSVTDGEAMRAIVQEIQRRWGRLDILVNAAGISPVFADAERLDDNDWRATIDTNLTGTFMCCRAAARLMLAAGSGSIVNVSSVHATSGFGKLAAYAASKGGVEALTRALAVEWAPHGVRVNAVAPGYFRTDLSKPLLESRWGEAIVNQIPLGRVAEPHELVDAVLFLVGSGSSYVTGSVLTVDGGWTAQ